MRRLKIPSAIAVTVLAGGATLVGLAGSSGAGCGGGESPPTEASVDEGGCAVFCIPDGTDAGVCPDPVECADPQGMCPPGCRPVG